MPVHVRPDTRLLRTIFTDLTKNILWQRKRRIFERQLVACDLEQIVYGRINKSC